MKQIPPNTKGIPRVTVGYYNIWARVLKVMIDGTFSLKEITAKTGIDYETLRPLINELRKSGVVYIESWQRDAKNRQSIAVYKLGLGVDAKKQPPRTGAARTRAYKQRQRSKHEDKLFKPIGKPLVANSAIDNAMRAWGMAA